MALALVKLSLLFQYLRITDERPDLKQRKLRWSILAMIGIVTTWGIVESLLAWIPSNPISADWDFTNKPALRWGYGSRDVETLSVCDYSLYLSLVPVCWRVCRRRRVVLTQPTGLQHRNVLSTVGYQHDTRHRRSDPPHVLKIPLGHRTSRREISPRSGRSLCFGRPVSHANPYPSALLKAKQP